MFLMLFYGTYNPLILGLYYVLFVASVVWFTFLFCI